MSIKLPEWRNCQHCHKPFFGYKMICPYCEKETGIDNSDPYTFSSSSFSTLSNYEIGDGTDKIQKQNDIKNKNWNEDGYEINDLIEDEIMNNPVEYLQEGFRLCGIEGTLEKLHKMTLPEEIRQRLLTAFDLLIRR